MREGDVSPAKLPLPSCDHDSSGLFCVQSAWTKIEPLASFPQGETLGDFDPSAPLCI